MAHLPGNAFSDSDCDERGRDAMTRYEEWEEVLTPKQRLDLIADVLVLILGQASDELPSDER